MKLQSFIFQDFYHYHFAYNWIMKKGELWNVMKVTFRQEDGEEACGGSAGASPRGGGAAAERAASQRADHGQAAATGAGQQRAAAGHHPATQEQEEENRAQCTLAYGWVLSLLFVGTTVVFHT